MHSDPISSPARQAVQFHSGCDRRAWRWLGAHPHCENGQSGWRFRLWAPHAVMVYVTGPFSGVQSPGVPMHLCADGIWEAFLPGLAELTPYRYAIHTRSGAVLEKADPYAFYAQLRPGTTSRLYDPAGYPWGDGAWMNYRKNRPFQTQPMNIYELHLGSWRRTGNGRWLSYRDIAAYLVPYVKEMGYTHVELLPVMEHPLDESWGYQPTGYFAATSRFGTPKDLMYLIDQCHQAGVGVILDWVPAHFPKDSFGLADFDGEACYEYPDPRQGEQPLWGTKVFDYHRSEVRSFLTSSALYWVELFHADGLRVDSVSPMVYLDFGHAPGTWLPNAQGGNENLSAVRFLRQLNRVLHEEYPDVLTIAEESTPWPHVTGSLVDELSLGFDLKWNLGWAHDVLHYQSLPPEQRTAAHKNLTFPLMYAFDEQFILPIAHDEVSAEKGSLVSRMPGSCDGEKLAGVRAFYLYMLTQPGKKLTMMGCEFGQFQAWNCNQSLDWHLLNYDPFRKQQEFFRAANALYLSYPTLWQADCSWDGFQWICPDEAQEQCLYYLRQSPGGQPLIVAVNFSSKLRKNISMGVPTPGTYEVVLSTDESRFGGWDCVIRTPIPSGPIGCHGLPDSISLDLPPYSAVALRLLPGSAGKPSRAAARKRQTQQIKSAFLYQ